MVTLWECFPEHFTGRNWYQIISSCYAAQHGDRGGDPELCWSRQEAQHTLTLAKGIWDKMSQLTPKNVFPWSLHIINFSGINRGVIWVNIRAILSAYMKHLYLSIELFNSFKLPNTILMEATWFACDCWEPAVRTGHLWGCVAWSWRTTACPGCQEVHFY